MQREFFTSEQLGRTLSDLARSWDVAPKRLRVRINVVNGEPLDVTGFIDRPGYIEIATPEKKVYVMEYDKIFDVEIWLADEEGEQAKPPIGFALPFSS